MIDDYYTRGWLLHKGMNSLRLLVDTRSVRPVTHPRLQARLFRAKPSLKNKIPVILSGVDGKLKNWRTLMGELRQFHPGLKVSHIKELPKGDFLVIGDSVKMLSYYKTNLKWRQLQVKMLRGLQGQQISKSVNLLYCLWIIITSRILNWFTQNKVLQNPYY